MKVKVQTLSGTGSAKAGGDIQLDDAVFGVEPRADILHRVVTWQLINRRAPARAARERSDVARTGKALALGHARNVDHLPGDEMVRADRRADVEERILGDAELDHSNLGLDLGLAERHALRLGDILGLGRAGAQLDGGVTVAIPLAAADDLDVLQLKNGDGHVTTVRLKQAGHPHLLCDHASAHDPHSYRGPSHGRGVRPVKRCVPRLGHSRTEARDAGDADRDARERPAVSLDPMSAR